MNMKGSHSVRSAAMDAAILSAVLGVSCRQAHLDSAPKKVEQQAQKEPMNMGTGEQHLQIRQSTVGQLGTYRIGIMAVAPMDSGEGSRARLAITKQGVTQAQRNDYETRAWVHGGELLPLGTSFYRVIEVRAPKRGLFDWRPGGSQEVVIIDRDPVQLADVTLLDNTMTLLRGGSGELHGREFEVEAIERRTPGMSAGPIARLAIWSNDLDKERAEKSDKIARVDVSVGSVVTLGTARHRVLAIMEARPAQGLPSFLQISSLADP